MFEILTPFSPPIYKSQIDNDTINMLKIISSQTKSSKQYVGNTLAGNIEQQFQAVMDVPQTEKFSQHIKTHLFNALLGFEKKYFKKPEEEKKFQIDKLHFHFGEGAWINFQHSGEFNPIHHHTGTISGIVYIEIPEVIHLENSRSTTVAPSVGAVSWIYGNASSSMLCTDYQYTHQPKTGEIFLFPSGLQHLVYPFSSDVERISMSFNLYDIHF